MKEMIKPYAQRVGTAVPGMGLRKAETPKLSEFTATTVFEI